MNHQIEKRIVKIMIDGKLEKRILVKSKGNGWKVKVDTKRDGISYVPIDAVFRYYQNKYRKQKVEFKPL